MTKKLKIAYQQLRLLLVLAEQDFEGTVQQLKAKIEERISDELGAHQSISEIQTADGFTVSLKEKVADVFESGSVVSCVDMPAFREKHIKLLDTSKLFIDAKVEDFQDNLAKWAQVGAHSHGKVFVRWGKGRTVDKFFLFGKTDLLDKLANPTAQNLQIGRSQETNWFIEAKFLVEEGNKLSVVIIVKTGSNKGIYCDKIFLNIPEKGYKVEASGEVIHVSAGTEEVEDDSLVSYELPAPQRTGPEIEDKVATTTSHQAEGDSTMDLTHNAEKRTEANMDSFARSGEFNNYFTIPEVTVVNKGASKASVVKTTLDYLDGSEWKPCKNVVIGTAYPSRWGFDYVWMQDGTNFTLDAGASVSIAVSGAVTCKGKPGSTNFLRARAHSSLPQPMKLKVTLEDSEGKKKSVIVEQANKSLGLATKQERKESWSLKNDLISFIYADDTEELERSFVALYQENDHELTIRPSNSYVYTWTNETLGGFVFKAAEQKKAEFPLEKMSDKKFQFALLVDLERKKAYGLKVKITTATSSVEETVLLPKLQKATKK